VVVTISWAWLAFVAVIMVVYAVRHLVLTGGRLLARQRPTLDEILDSELRPLSVLVPMHNEGAVAARILDRLTASDYPKDQLEVVVIDDHSDDTTPETLSRYASEHPFIHPLHRRAGVRGKPAGLNDALAVASHEHTLVFDADYEPSGELIRGLAAAFHDPEVGAVMGRVVPKNTDVNLLTRLLDLERSGGYQVDQQQRESFRLVPQYGGTVGGFRSPIVRGWGGFDPRVLAEDTDATFQLAIRGWRIAYSNRAECYEEVPHTWDGRFRQLRRWARGHTQVLARRVVPVLRSRYLTVPQKLDSLLVLGIYLVPPLLLSGLVANVILFLGGAAVVVTTTVLGLLVVAYTSVGTSAPFFQIGAAGLIDGSHQRLLLVPLLTPMYFFNTCAIGLGFLDAIGDYLRRRTPAWDKTRRLRETA